MLTLMTTSTSDHQLAISQLLHCCHSMPCHACRQRHRVGVQWAHCSRAVTSGVAFIIDVALLLTMDTWLSRFQATTHKYTTSQKPWGSACVQHSLAIN